MINDIFIVSLSLLELYIAQLCGHNCDDSAAGKEQQVSKHSLC